MLASLPEREVECLGADVITNDGASDLQIPEELLNKQHYGNMPAHRLKLKRGAVVMLLRNLDPSRGLSNGVRMIVLDIVRNRYLKCKLIAGSRAGNDVLIPRIKLAPPKGRLPVSWYRLQFPVRVSYCMTSESSPPSNPPPIHTAAQQYPANHELRWNFAVNKSQGQTLERVALFLGKPTLNDDGTLRSIDDQACFAHGQLYVALSRVGHPDRVRKLLLMRRRQPNATLKLFVGHPCSTGQSVHGAVTLRHRKSTVCHLPRGVAVARAVGHAGERRLLETGQC